MDTVYLKFGTGYVVEEERVETFLLLSCTLQFSKEDNEKVIPIVYGKVLIHYIRLWNFVLQEFI